MLEKYQLRAGSGGRTDPTIPVFSLYGEHAAFDEAEFVHIEDIRARSERYDWLIKPHQHRGLFQMIFLLKGRANVHADGRPLEIAAPCAISIPPTVVHGFRFEPDTDGFVLTIAEAMLRSWRHGRILVDALFAEPLVIDFAGMPGGAERIDGLLAQIVAELRDSQPGRALMSEWLVGSVLMMVARQLTSATQANAASAQLRDAFNRFRVLVEQHYLEHWNVARYARAMRMTEGRLNRLCRAVAGKSAFDVIQDRLLIEAKRRLIYIAAPVSLLSYELGFEDPAYFSRYFKKRAGVTPSVFRRRERERSRLGAG